MSFGAESLEKNKRQISEQERKRAKSMLEVIESILSEMEGGDENVA